MGTFAAVILIATAVLAYAIVFAGARSERE